MHCHLLTEVWSVAYWHMSLGPPSLSPEGQIWSKCTFNRKRNSFSLWLEEWMKPILVCRTHSTLHKIQKHGWSSTTAHTFTTFLCVEKYLGAIIRTIIKILARISWALFSLPLYFLKNSVLRVSFALSQILGLLNRTSGKSEKTCCDYFIGLLWRQLKKCIWSPL